jgi:hypothetical protein
MATKKYSKKWKENQTENHGGWAQKDGDVWKWHYIKRDCEYAIGSYFSKESCEDEYKTGCTGRN